MSRSEKYEEFHIIDAGKNRGGVQWGLLGLSLPTTSGRWSFTLNPGLLLERLRSDAPALLFGLRLWVSVCLALYVAFYLELDNAYWAGTTAAIVCQPNLGASLRKGWFRMIGTVMGAVAGVVLITCFPQHRAAFLVSLALWAAACALIATLLRNFASYAAAMAGITAAIIALDQLGATGDLNGQAFTFAVIRDRPFGRLRRADLRIFPGTDLRDAPQVDLRGFRQCGEGTKCR